LRGALEIDLDLFNTGSLAVNILVLVSAQKGEILNY
jgi:hypothetical protein